MTSIKRGTTKILTLLGDADKAQEVLKRLMDTNRWKRNLKD